MVTIVDPHVKRDSGYYVYKEASEKKYFVRTKDGTEFDGWCWPGAVYARSLCSAVF
jgi:alpha 1,3-glucosidase